MEKKSSNFIKSRSVIYAIVLLFLLIGGVSDLKSNADNRVLFRKYTMDNGLSSNRIYSVVQDSLGFIWFGTNNGLNRFDGINFKKYYFSDEDSNSISSNSVKWLMIANDNKMWISLDNGIDIYDPKADSFSRFDLTTTTGEGIDGRVQEIMEDKEGNIWIGTKYNGLFRYSPRDKKLTVYKHIPGDPSSLAQDWVTTMFEDREGTIWIGTYSEGLSAFSKKTNKFTNYKKTNNNKGPSDNTIQCFYEDSFGYLWIATLRSGLDRFDKRSQEFTNYRDAGPHNLLYHIHDMIEYKPGELLITSDIGIGIFHIVEGELKYDSDYNNQLYPNTNKIIHKAFVDMEGSLWLGSYFNGIEYFPSFQNKFRYYNCSRSSNPSMGKIVKDICEGEKGVFWIGTDDDGIYTYDITEDVVKPFRTAADINTTFYCITDLVIDDGKLFVATYERGLEIFDLETKSVRSYLFDAKDSKSIPSSLVYSLFKSNSGRIYIGTDNGLCYYNRKEDNFVRMKLDFRIGTIVEDKHNNLWIATKGNGLYYYDTKKDEYKHYSFDINNKKSLIRNALSTLTYDSKGRLWVGSSGYGICRYDEETDSFVRYNDLELPNNVISQIIPDGDFLWISTNKGLAKWDPSTNHLKVFSKSNGLSEGLFSPNSGLISSGGNIFLGSANGFCAFSPHNLVKNEYNPPLRITNFTINNKPITSTCNQSPLKSSIETVEEIELEYNQSTIGFEIASLSYLDSQNNMYEYILEGFDEEWLTTNGQNRYINYTNLPAGNYTLKVKGTNSDGIWSSNEVALQISVKPHFLKSNTAFFLYFVCFALIVGVLAWYFIRASRKKQDEKIKLIEVKSQKEIYDSKIEFFTNIAHEIRTPLSLIIGPLEYIMKWHSKDDKITEYLSIISLNYKRLYDLINQLLDFRKIDSGNYNMRYDLCSLSALVTEIVSLFKLTAEQQKIEISTVIDPADLQLMTDKEALTKIITNVISNALKYASKNIFVNAYQNQEEVYITVEDDGIGISVEERENVFKAFYQINSERIATGKGVGVGLHMTKSLVELMGGAISVSDRDGDQTGVKIIIKLPVINQIERDDIEETEKTDSRVDSSDDSNINAIGERLEWNDAGKKYSIMIVDDNPDILEFLSKILEQDYSIVSALSGTEALSKLEKKQVDLIVSDIMMDGMSGLELCKHIRENINTSHIPIVLLTAKTDMDTKIKSLDLGADAYIEKPFSPFHLRAQLRNLLTKREELKQSFASMPLSGVKITTHNKLDEEFVEKCTYIITENLSSSEFSVDTLAREIGMSRTSIFVKLKAIMDMTPNDFIKVIRLKKACEMMAEGRYSISEISFLVGFSSSSYFTKCFSKQFGMLPTEYIKSLENI